MTSVYFTIDLVLLGWLVAGQRLGDYAAATKVLSLLVVVPGLLMNAAVPGLSGAVGDRARTTALASRLAHWMAATGLPVCVAAAIFAPQMITIAFGSQYRGAAVLTRVLVLAAVLALASNIVGNILGAAGVVRPLLIQNAVAIVFNVAGNLLLVPRYGVIASAWLTVATELLVLSAATVVVRDRVDLRQTMRATLRPSLAVGTSAVVALLLLPYPLVAILAATATFAAAIVLLRAWPVELMPQGRVQAAKADVAGSATSDPADAGARGATPEAAERPLAGIGSQQDRAIGEGGGQPAMASVVAPAAGSHETLLARRVAAGSAHVHQRDGRHVDSESAVIGQAPAEIDVLVVGRETLVERPVAARIGGPHEPTGGPERLDRPRGDALVEVQLACCGNRGLKVDEGTQQPARLRAVEVAGELVAKAREPLARGLRSPIGIDQPRPHQRDPRVGLEHVAERCDDVLGEHRVGVEQQDVVRIADGDEPVVGPREPEIAIRTDELDIRERGGDHVGAAIGRGVVEHANPHLRTAVPGDVSTQRGEAGGQVVPGVVGDDEDVDRGRRRHAGGPMSAITMCR